MGPKIRFALCLVVATVVCAYQWMGVSAFALQSPWWPLAALVAVAAMLAFNTQIMRAAGVAVGWGRGRQLPTFGLNLATAVTVLFVLATVLRGLLA